MDAANAGRKIRERLESGALPKDFDLTFLSVGHPPPNINGAGCGEPFLPSNTDAIGQRDHQEKRYWFHDALERTTSCWNPTKATSSQARR